MSLNLFFQAQNLWGAVGDYRRRRDEGQGRFGAAIGAYVNARVYAHPGVMVGMMAPPIVRKLLIERPQRNMHAIRHSTAVFSRGIFPDNELLAQSQSAQMQSAVMANGTLSMAGRSWAGMEASVFHGRYQ